MIAMRALLLSLALLAGTASAADGDAAVQAPAATPVEAGADAPASRPFDAIDSWDDLSRGADPTADPTAGPR